MALGQDGDAGGTAEALPDPSPQFHNHPHLICAEIQVLEGRATYSRSHTRVNRSWNSGLRSQTQCSVGQGKDNVLTFPEQGPSFSAVLL